MSSILLRSVVGNLHLHSPQMPRPRPTHCYSSDPAQVNRRLSIVRTSSDVSTGHSLSQYSMKDGSWRDSTLYLGITSFHFPICREKSYATLERSITIACRVRTGRCTHQSSLWLSKVIIQVIIRPSANKCSLHKRPPYVVLHFLFLLPFRLLLFLLMLLDINVRIIVII
jgi:hypothetical protein